MVKRLCLPDSLVMLKSLFNSKTLMNAPAQVLLRMATAHRFATILMDPTDVAVVRATFLTEMVELAMVCTKKY